jgi:long-chain acyl-CoA synthetase
MFVDLRPDETRAPWAVHYPETVPARLRYPEEPVWWLLEEAARTHPERAACRYYNSTWSYRQLLENARRFAKVLVRSGLKPGARVGLLLPTCPQYLMACYGVWLAGGVVVSLSPLSVAEENGDLLSATNCGFVVALDLFAGQVPAGRAATWTPLKITLRRDLPFLTRLGYDASVLRRNIFQRSFRQRSERSKHWLSVEAMMSESDSSFAGVHTWNRSAAYMLATGGTTGDPKVVVLTHRNLVANAWQLMHWVGTEKGKETFLGVLPLFHSYGLSTCVTGGIGMAATLILSHRFQPGPAVELIERHRPTMFFAVPAMLAAMNEVLRRRGADLSSLKCCISGGAPLASRISETFAAYSGARVVEGYGLSEASPVTHVNPLDGTDRPGTIGLPLPDTEALVVDRDTGEQVLGPGQVGELVVRGPQVMLGYWNKPDETRKVLRNSWLYTGDLATYDEDGFFRIVDRKKDIIITSGFNVYPSEVESVLRRFPNVSDAAVVGVPHPRRGEVVKAVLVMRRGNPFSRRTFEAFLKQHLAHHKRPRIVEIRESDLPRNFLGKVMRRRLRGVPPEATPASRVISLWE